MIRLYLCLLAGLVAAALTVEAVSAVTGNELGAVLLGDAVFILGSACCVWRMSTVPMSAAVSVLGAVFTFIATGIAFAYVGGPLYVSAPVIGHILVRAFSIGLYPAGADVPFEIGAIFWSASMLPLCAVILALAALLKYLRPPFKG